MTDSANNKPFLRTRETAVRSHWLFEIEPYSRAQGESLTELRDNLRLKKALRRALELDLAPIELIESVRTMIRA